MRSRSMPRANTSVATSTGTTTGRVSTSTQSADDSGPKLIGEPLLIRLVGTAKPTAEDGSPQLRYALILRSTRGLRPGSSGLGLVLVRNRGLGLYPRPPFATREGVFCGIDFLEGEGTDEEAPTTASGLDRSPKGTTVPLHITLFRRPGPLAKFVRRVPIMESRLRSPPILPTGLFSPDDFRSKSVRRAIKRLGCG